jgi:hypothetical protein
MQMTIDKTRCKKVTLKIDDIDRIIIPKPNDESAMNSNISLRDRSCKDVNDFAIYK